MLQRFILEIAEPPGRMTLYDYDSRQRLNEITGDEWQTIIEQLAKLDVGCCGEQGPGDIWPLEPGRLLDATTTAARIPQISAPLPSPSSDNEGETSWRTLVEGAASSQMIALTRSAEPVQESRKTSRRKLWEIPHKLHCPIIGTCLEVAELRRIGARFAWRNKERPSEYEIHVSFVAAADERNAISQATHKLLDKKYAATIRRYSKARSPEDLLALWSEALACGEVPGAFWALMTHPKADPSVMALAYEEVHMLSHQIGAGQRADLKRLSETRQELAQLRRDFDASQQRTKQQADSREREIQQLTHELRQREDECTQLRERERDLSERLTASGLDEHQRELRHLRERASQLQEALSASESEMAVWREKHALAQSEIERLAGLAQQREADCAALERLFQQAATPPCEDCPNEGCEARADLAGRLVLCVGGYRPRLEQYRRLVASCNGRFDHHDGGLEDNQHRLESMLAAADAVVCATDFVSHTAYYRTKRFCKRFDKPHVLLGSSGVSAFARALEQVAG